MDAENEQKKPKRQKRKFSDEYKAGAVAMVLREGKSVTGVAKDVGLVVSVLGRWVEQARADAGKSKRGTLTTEEKRRAVAIAEGSSRAALGA